MLAVFFMAFHDDSGLILPWIPTALTECAKCGARGGAAWQDSLTLSQLAFGGAMFAVDINPGGQSCHCWEPSGIYFKTRTIEVLWTHICFTHLMCYLFSASKWQAAWEKGFYFLPSSTAINCSGLQADVTYSLAGPWFLIYKINVVCDPSEMAWEWHRGSDSSPPEGIIYVCTYIFNDILLLIIEKRIN